MNDLSKQSIQLPSNLEDLSKFVLVGRERLTAVRAEIRAIQKVGLAKEVHEQKLAEAQDIAEAVLDAEAKIGELTKAIPTKSGARTDIKPCDNGDTRLKEERLESIGLDRQQASRFERLANHPQAVEAAKEQAREEGRIVTRQDVLNRIPKEPKKLKNLNDIVDVVREDRGQYEQAKQDTIVDIADAHRYAENKELIVNETLLKVLKSANHASDIMVIPVEELDEMIESISDQQFEDLQRTIAQGIKTLVKVQTRMEVKRCRKTDRTDSTHFSQRKSDGGKILNFSS